MQKEQIADILKNPKKQQIIAESDFHFQKGQDALKKWLDMKISDGLKTQLLELSKDYDQIQEEAKTNQEIKTVLEHLFEIISYCDSKAKDKLIYNQYEDKRCLAMAFVRMNNWVEHLILFKLNPTQLKVGSTKNAFNYLLDPGNNATILSENHRELIIKNLSKKEFDSVNFVNDLKSLFREFNISVKNPLNYTDLLS
ncbi:MAG: hypothetical protein HOP37_00140, partial [Cyclobacteriaceae bacterium]|nr:hypothetical protein [Cyclobacteriaceae bacterium]